MEPLNIRGRLLLLEYLPNLIADVVVQQLRPHHCHEHRAHHDGHPHNDPKLKKGTESLLAPWNRRSFSGCGSAARSLRPPGWDLAGRLTFPHLVKLGLISPVYILVAVTLVGLRIVQVWVA